MDRPQSLRALDVFQVTVIELTRRPNQIVFPARLIATIENLGYSALNLIIQV